MGWQPGKGDGTGEEPLPEPGAHGGTVRDERLAGFAGGGEWEVRPPGPELAAVLAAVAGEEWRCPGADPEELVGVLRRAAALESWAAAVKLGVIREMFRQDDLPGAGRPRHGDLPDQWSDSLNHELALALACSVQSAEKTALAAWELGARLPGIAALLADGTLAYAKARLIAETFQLLSDADAARAEALLLPRLVGATGKTFGQIAGLASRIAAQVDPGLAERRRKAAVKHASRVQLLREQSGAACLSGRELPPDETLAANANVAARAMEYKASGAFPGAGMDEFRSTAYLDLINGRTTDGRIALGHLSTDPPDPDAAPWGETATQNRDGDDPDDDEPGGTARPGGNGPGCGGPGHGSDPDGGEPGGSGAGGQVPPAFQRKPGGRPVLADLVIPLATLLGLAERPGEAHGLGVLDPGLCRDLAVLAVASPHTLLCVTVTDTDGVAIGHGCGRPGRLSGQPWEPKSGASSGWVPAGAPPPSVALPARVNLTITADCLSAMLSGSFWLPGSTGSRATGWGLARAGKSGRGRVARAGPRSAGGLPGDPDSRGDPEWSGTWVLTLSGGLELAVRVDPLPTRECDHRYESHGYQPNDRLRHLVQVRDHVCTFPSCSRHARESDFEHARPYDQGGRTCSCNAGARSRKCHRIKQSPGWDVTQPRPAWHVWTTPSGRTYTQAPYQYPV